MSSARTPFLIVGTKGARGDAIREVTRLDHLRFMIENQDRVSWGGALEAPDGTWGGMALIVDCDDRPDAEAWIAAEPYRKAGVFADLMVAPFRQVTPEPTPGWLAAELAEEQRRRDARMP